MANPPVRYFHVCPIILEVGSVLKAGNFGRIIEQYRVATVGALAARELCYEIMRLKHYPARPSRMNSFFFFRSKEAAERNLQKFNPTSLIYEVELLDDKADIFHGDTSLIESNIPSPDYPVIPFFMTVAAQYWIGRNGTEDINSEYLCNSSARIVAVHDPRMPVEAIGEELRKLSAAAASTSS